MNLRELKNEFTESLKDTYSKREADRLFFIFLEDFLKIKRIDYLSGPGAALDENQLKKLRTALHRLKKGEPYQHILERLPFAGLDLKVSKAALIPRPETEELVYLIRDKYRGPSPENILDIGTGTGCMALACARFFPGAKVTGIDILEPALELARINAESNGLQAEFIRADFLRGDPRIYKGWDLIISNPPYIAMEEYHNIEALVKDNEPLEALFVQGDDPLIFYRKTAAFAQEHLNSGGRVFLEINEKLGAPTLEVFQASFHQAGLLKDMSGKERFIVAEKP